MARLLGFINISINKVGCVILEITRATSKTEDFLITNSLINSLSQYLLLLYGICLA